MKEKLSDAELADVEKSFDDILREEKNQKVKAILESEEDI
jgi:hypothetical protein